VIPEPPLVVMAASNNWSQASSTTISCFIAIWPRTDWEEEM
jgi:hypothetical protein